ncbi:hypothetical protein GCM10027020_27640 [Nocardioides salsibiostraticola]
MSRSKVLLPVIIVCLFALAACGGESEPTAALSDSPPVETPVEAEASVTPEATDVPDSGSVVPSAEGDCTTVVTAEEITTILSTPEVEITGAGEQCRYTFAADSVGTVGVYSGAKADQAMDELLAKYDPNFGGVLLDDGRGLVQADLNGRVLVRGDSGRVFVFAIPDNIETENLQASLEELAALVLTR